MSARWEPRRLWIHTTDLLTGHREGPGADKRLPEGTDATAPPDNRKWRKGGRVHGFKDNTCYPFGLLLRVWVCLKLLWLESLLTWPWCWALFHHGQQLCAVLVLGLGLTRRGTNRELRALLEMIRYDWVLQPLMSRLKWGTPCDPLVGKLSIWL